MSNSNKVEIEKILDAFADVYDEIIENLQPIGSGIDYWEDKNGCKFVITTFNLMRCTSYRYYLPEFLKLFSYYFPVIRVAQSNFEITKELKIKYRINGISKDHLIFYMPLIFDKFCAYLESELKLKTNRE